VTKRKKTVSAPSLDQQIIIDTPLEDELSTSYMEYALSVIVSRAIPDARDGLKPVQRRLLYAMDQSFLSSDKPYRKSIAAVGETMKKYHPHGDAAIYETLVRMAQPWVMNAALVDGHGNFGSLDDGPAASRYTEARLSQLAEALLRDVDQDTVDMHPNFDASTKEPSVLPAAFPNLLVNGASGIAVGMATSLPPHNLTEVVEACMLLLDNPKASLGDILKVLPAPDFPTGGVLMVDKKALYEMYSSGKGSVRVRVTL
jgi:DNA gyrase subunit A